MRPHFIFPAHVSGRLVYNSLMLDKGFGVGGCEKKIGCRSVYDNWDGLSV